MLPLKNAVLKPDALNSRSVTHPVFAKQFTLLIPLPAHAVELPALIRLFGCEHSVFMPVTRDAVPSAISQPHFFANLAVPIKTSLDGGAHTACAVCPPPTPPFDGIKQGSRSNAKPELFTFTKEGARTQHAPARGTAKRPGKETRRAAPEWARAPAAPFPSKIRGFLAGPSRCDAKWFFFDYIIRLNQIYGNHFYREFVVPATLHPHIVGNCRELPIRVAKRRRSSA